MKRFSGLVSSVVLRILLLVCMPSAVLSGCVFPVHLADPEPFQDEELSGILIDATTREEINDLFGQPTARFADDRWWVFEKSRRLSEWLVIFGYMYVADVATLGGGEEKHALVVEFVDQDLVGAVNVVRDVDYCDHVDFICYSDGRLFLDASVESTVPHEAGSCRVYLYADRPLMPHVWAKFQVDSDGPILTVPSSTAYVRIDVPFGSHDLTVMTLVPEHFSSSMDFFCAQGESHFFGLVEQESSRLRLMAHEPEVGRQAIASRRFVLGDGERSNPGTEELQ